MAGDTVLKAFLSVFVVLSCFFLISKAMTLSWKEIRFVWHDLFLKKPPTSDGCFLVFLLSVWQNAVTLPVPTASYQTAGVSEGIRKPWTALRILDPTYVINTLFFPADAESHEQLLSLLTRKCNGLFSQINFSFFIFCSNGSMASTEGINLGTSALPGGCSRATPAIPAQNLCRICQKIKYKFISLNLISSTWHILDSGWNSDLNSSSGNDGWFPLVSKHFHYFRPPCSPSRCQPWDIASHLRECQKSYRNSCRSSARDTLKEQGWKKYVFSIKSLIPEAHEGHFVSGPVQHLSAGR